MLPFLSQYQCCTMTNSFTPDWCRQRRENDVIDASSSSAPFWWSCSCLVCGKPPPNNELSSSKSHHKRCARCKAAVYCSAECQKQDYIDGKHKAICNSIAKLWERKKNLEDLFWESKTIKSTNFFDDEEIYHEYPTVGEFWHDQPQSVMQKNTTKYVVTLLQLIQLLGRGESWRVSKIQSSTLNEQSTTSRRRGEGNPLARELAIDLAFQLLYLDRTDMRVRLLIAPLLLEGGYYQEAYDYLKYWLLAETSMMLMDLALMGGEEVGDEQTMSFLGMKGENILESPEDWIDGEMVYPSIGMVFELAFLKCTLLYSLRSGDHHSSELNGIAGKSNEEELERQTALLLSLVHKWNSNLLPNLAERDGASSDRNDSSTPPGLDTLLNKQPPGFELQYKMGNPGGQTLDEAVAIWQRDMILWHVVDPMTMEYLSNFSTRLQENLVSVDSLKGAPQINGSSTSCDAEYKHNEENANQRKEAEELVKRLKEENPDRTMDQIMMHPEMAQLMIKHLHTEK